MKRKKKRREKYDFNTVLPVGLILEVSCTVSTVCVFSWLQGLDVGTRKIPKLIFSVTVLWWQCNATLQTSQLFLILGRN
jgi:hypothetical protein